MLRTLVSNDIKRQTRLLNDNERVELMECNYSFDWNVPTVNWAEYRIAYSTFWSNGIYIYITLARGCKFGFEKLSLMWNIIDEIITEMYFIYNLDYKKW